MPNVEFVWNETETDIILDEEDFDTNQEIIIKEIIHFFKKLNAKDIDIGIITKMVQNNIDNIKTIINLSANDYLKLPGIKEKMANKLFNSIQTSIKDVQM